MGSRLHEAEKMARSLGDHHRLARVTTFTAFQCQLMGDYKEALRLGTEALTLARALGDHSIHVVVIKRRAGSLPNCNMR